MGKREGRERGERIRKWSRERDWRELGGAEGERKVNDGCRRKTIMLVRLLALNLDAE